MEEKDKPLPGQLPLPGFTRSTLVQPTKGALRCNYCGKVFEGMHAAARFLAHMLAEGYARENGRKPRRNLARLTYRAMAGPTTDPSTNAAPRSARGQPRHPTPRPPRAR